MKSLMIGACLAAMLIPPAAMAQNYGQDQGGYPDQSGPNGPGQGPPPDQSDQGDYPDQGGPGGQGQGGYQDRGPGPDEQGQGGYQGQSGPEPQDQGGYPPPGAGGGYHGQNGPQGPDYGEGGPDQGGPDEGGPPGQGQGQNGYYGQQGGPDEGGPPPGGYGQGQRYGGPGGGPNGRGGMGPGVPPGAHFTSRLGQSWQAPDGRTCRWRELTWQGANGQPAYKWVPRCHW